MKSLFEQIGGTYELGMDGKYYPNLISSEEEPRYGKYGKMRKKFLREHRKGFYSALLMEGKLVAHLNEIDDIANARMELLVEQMSREHKVDEGLKSKNQMAWIGNRNNIQNVAEEIIFREVIFN
jgi:hypothetical protein